MNVKQMVSKYYQHIPKTVLKLFFTPRNLVVEPIAGCNVTCSACPQDILKRNKGMMSMGIFLKIIKKAKPKSIGLYFMGEPFLNPDIFDMINYAGECGVKTTINTNGSTLIRDCNRIMNSSLSKIAVSIDGVTQEVFGAYRRGIDAEQVLEGLKLLSMVKSHMVGGPNIQVRTLLFEPTLGEIEDIDQFVASCNISDHRHIEPILTGWGDKVNSDLDVLGTEGRLKNKKPEICPSLFRMAITWDGNVLPCCNDVHGENVFGNIKDGSWENIVWGSDKWILKAKRMFKICKNCFDGE